VLVCLFMLPHVWAGMVALPLLLARGSTASMAVLELLLHAVYFAVTSIGRPASTGCRESARTTAWLHRNLAPVFAWWFGSCEARPDFCMCRQPRSPHPLCPR
jgi:hypothetical protein